ncbi:ATP-NAD kinase-like domain-containing protein, partial [Baffinella frigidus]
HAAGDGTILWVSGLYPGPCPPILSFSMGSLGFLTPFDFRDYKTVLGAAIKADVVVGVRTRLKCTIHDEMKHRMSDFAVSVDRGPSPLLTNVDVYCDDRFVLSSQGDGIILSTPTGSTAYSLAAGGSMVHPDVPGILLTPICPQTLSFRPIVFPDSVTLRLQVPDNATEVGWCSFDGRNAMALQKNWSVTVVSSKWPIPIMKPADVENDWFQGVMDSLNWNVRKAQGALDKGFERSRPFPCPPLPTHPCALLLTCRHTSGDTPCVGILLHR